MSVFPPGYMMNTINFGKARLQAGVRVEGTQDSFVGNQINVNGSDFVPGTLVQVPGEASYVDVLPSVQFQYRVGSDTLLRAAYGMGISRPNFGDLPPFVTFDPTIAPGQPSVSAGNPNLKPTHAQNFDFLVERYLKNVGIIQGGVFYHYLKDPIYENVITPLTSGPFAGQLQSAPINGPRAHLTGIEMDGKRLTFLPGLLSGSGIGQITAAPLPELVFQRDLGGAIMWRCCARRRIIGTSITPMTEKAYRHEWASPQ